MKLVDNSKQLFLHFFLFIYSSTLRTHFFLFRTNWDSKITLLNNTSETSLNLLSISLTCWVHGLILQFSVLATQVGIIITLMWSPSVKPMPVAYNGNEPFNMPGSCYGGSEGDETLGWLERRVRHIKEEIVITELRLQDLHEGLAALKVHADRLQESFSQTSLESRSTHANSL